MVKDKVKQMLEDEVKQIEEEIYEDLSPIREAAENLNKKLPIDAKTLSDETWHFFHFETEDYATMKRTIEVACEKHQWKFPAIFSMEEWTKVIVKEKDTLTLENFKKSMLKVEEIKQNRPVFIYASYEEELSTKAEKMRYLQMFEIFKLYCSERRSELNGIQIREQETKLDFTTAYYNRIFFVSYGLSCRLPDYLKNSLYTISYSFLKPEDFKCLLWEFHLRKEKLLQKEREDVGLPQTGLRELVLSESLLEWYADSMSGLEEIQVRRLLAIMDGEFESKYDVDYTNQERVKNVIVDYKKEILKQHGRLEIIQVKENEQVVGLDAIQSWLDKRKEAIKSYKSSYTGILLVGVPGTGKSATAKETAKCLGLTLVRLDMSRILGGRVGDSETGMRETLQDLKFVAPCVLWIDEIEKAMSGANGKSNDGNSTITRLFGMLLTFIQENDRPIFIITTANDISNLPPEFFRNGRFDQTFCLMMPEYKSCIEIMQRKLNDYAEKMGWEYEFKQIEVAELFNQCVGTPESPRFLTGADIDAHVKELFHICERTKIMKYPGLPSMREKMKEISKEMRVQAEPSAPHTMEEIAKCYLNMMKRGFKMAGKENPFYTGDKLRLHNIYYYKFNKEKELPLCIAEPAELKSKNYREFKNKEEQKAEWYDTPAKWYDARFFYELNKSMAEVVFLDKEMILPSVQGEYLELMRYIMERKFNE